MEGWPQVEMTVKFENTINAASSMTKKIRPEGVDACVDFGAEEIQAKQDTLCGIL